MEQEHQFIDYIEPVSYTHLDVYKRQVEDIAAPRAIAPLFLFGEENRYPVEVTANEPTEVIEIPKTSVLELFRKNEQFLENYMNLSANYARTLSDKLFFMSFKTIRQKIASYLLRLYKQQQQLHLSLIHIFPPPLYL